ncbi:hypothetical protein [uncultured Modestobacter sp.]|uniref:hypothetical protein n=1 Tax=uncultured Modestobacter sp. TaxID=380048 RepID=UPI002623B4B2|nr:hypothetical protein [uncultured Modestobacter sp.]
MATLEHRIADFLEAPLAAALFVLAARNNVTADQLADPATSCTLASIALRELNPWSGGSRPSIVRADVLKGVRPLRSLVADVLADERNAWWGAPLQHDDQLLLVGREDRQPDPAEVPAPTGAISSWETYAQKPRHGLVTSTELAVPADEPIRSSAHAELACGASDWDATYPVAQQRLQVAAHTRIAEVNSAADWHALSTRYGDPATHHGSDTNLREVAEIDNGLAPTWSALAVDYDGVHLSFAGLLSALYVPVSSPSVGATTLWAWDWECTHWIRSAFTATTALPQLTEPPQAANYWQPLG